MFHIQQTAVIALPICSLANSQTTFGFAFQVKKHIQIRANAPDGKNPLSNTVASLPCCVPGFQGEDDRVYNLSQRILTTLPQQSWRGELFPPKGIFSEGFNMDENIHLFCVAWGYRGYRFGVTEWTVILRMSSKAADVFLSVLAAAGTGRISQNTECLFHDKAGLIKASYWWLVFINENVDKWDPLSIL